MASTRGTIATVELGDARPFAKWAAVLLADGDGVPRCAEGIKDAGLSIPSAAVRAVGGRAELYWLVHDPSADRPKVVLKRRRFAAP